MRRLSVQLDQLRDSYDAVVVGSGYGGGVAAARLAMAGRRVCVLERGRERHAGDFPATLLATARQSQVRTPTRRWGSRTALFDLRIGPELSVLIGCGLGGTSLINAGVALRPADRVFDDDRWPAALRGRGREVLAPYFARAERMLGVSAYPQAWPHLPRLAALETAAAAVGGEVSRPPIAVSFRAGPNPVGVEQSACQLCGDCVTGCNHGAKHTVATTYLPLAVRHGAQVFTEVEVRTVLPSPVGGWVVTFAAPGHGNARGSGPALFVRADVVVLAAGALGSTEILLRSRLAGLDLSPRLGHAFNANGNAMALAYDGDVPIRGFGLGRRATPGREAVGPSIAGLLRVPLPERDLLIEDGVIPAPLRPVMPLALAAAATVIPPGRRLDPRRLARQLLAGPLDVLSAGRGPSQRTLLYLMAGDEPGDGRLTFEGDGVRIASCFACDDVLRGADAEVLRATAAALGAEFVVNPLSRPTRHDAPLTVHPLGGCPMGDDGAAGVVDDRGRVFRGTGPDVHDGLFVVDGAIVPMPLATNPMLTITALAERASDLLLGHAAVEEGAGPPQVVATAPGLRFNERMTGYIGPAGGTPEEGAALGRADGTAIEFVLTVRIDDLPALLDDPARPGSLVGTVVAALLSPRRLRVVDGVFRLVQRDPSRVGTWQMRYAMGLLTDDGRRFRLEGTKLMHGTGLAAWTQTTTLRVTISEPTTGEPVATGVLTLSPADFARLLASMQVTGVPGRFDRARWLARFQARFARSLLSIYAGPLGEAGKVAAARRPVPLTGSGPRAGAGRALRVPEPEPRWCGGDGRWHEGNEPGRDAWLRLIRYPGGPLGPVIVAPGLGMSATSFLVDTIETNLVEHLVAGGYDVWLFDYRAGIDLPSARAAFTIDDIALRDWPTAVAEVRRATGATVQVVGHCMGSATLMMALAAGLTGVRSAVCMQSTLHLTTSTLNDAKLALRVDRLLGLIGLRNVAPLRGQTLPNAILDRLLRAVPMPSGERCGKAICHWINAVYGCTHRHAQLNEATHELIDDLFGVGDLAALGHIARMVRRGSAEDAGGADLYLAHPERLRLPILLVQGQHNAIFRPEGSLRTLRWLAAANGAEHYERVVLPDYAHLDAVIGRDAWRDVYPLITDHLDRW